DALKPVMELFTELSAKSAAGMVSFIEGLDFTDFTAAVPIVVDGIRNILALFDQIGTIAKRAWESVFPSDNSGTKVLTNIATAFKNFTEGLAIGGRQMGQFKRAFAGVLAVFDIAWMVIKG